PNGVDPVRFTVGRPPPGPNFTVGFVGTLKPWHGIETLIEAVAILASADRSYRLLIVGDGPQRAKLEELAQERGLADLTCFTGSVKPRRVPYHLSRMEAAVAPYPDLPGFYFSPLKLFEYLAAGLPVVASRVGQMAELISDGKTGLLCPPGDPPALAEAVALLRRRPDLRARLGRAGRALVERSHTWDQVVDRVLRLVERPVRSGASS
ncbi:MAG: glycosyltransferase family 4 protein, partial [Acidimicrobiia bacterium]